MQWVLGAVAASSLPWTAPGDALGQEAARNPTPAPPPNATPPAASEGYGVDPVLNKIYHPGECWPLTFDDGQKRAAAALADTILPRDHLGPAASEVGVIEMIDEWVSAPYPRQRADRTVVLKGLAWIDAESSKRFAGKIFAATDEPQRRAICVDICPNGAVRREFEEAATFFNRFRALCAGAYYATPAGWKAIGYVGNVALASFDGPPQEVLDKLGVTQTVK